MEHTILIAGEPSGTPGRLSGYLNTHRTAANRYVITGTISAVLRATVTRAMGVIEAEITPPQPVSSQKLLRMDTMAHLAIRISDA